MPPQGGPIVGAWERPRGRRAPHLQPRRSLLRPALCRQVSSKAPIPRAWGWSCDERWPVGVGLRLGPWPWRAWGWGFLDRRRVLGHHCWGNRRAVRGGTHQVSGARQASAVKGSHEAHSGCVTEPAQLSFLPQLQGLPPLSWREGLRGPGWVVAWGVAGRWHVLLERGCGSGVSRASLVSREREEVPAWWAGEWGGQPLTSISSWALGPVDQPCWAPMARIL